MQEKKLKYSPGAASQLPPCSASPKPKLPQLDAKEISNQQTIEVLNSILPPRLVARRRASWRVKRGHQVESSVPLTSRIHSTQS